MKIYQKNRTQSAMLVNIENKKKCVRFCVGSFLNKNFYETLNGEYFQLMNNDIKKIKQLDITKTKIEDNGKYTTVKTYFEDGSIHGNLKLRFYRQLTPGGKLVLKSNCQHFDY